MESPPASGPGPRSAVLVPVPAAEPVVGPHRARFDGAAVLGVPAHVTVLFPFLAPAAITDATVRRLAAAVASVPAFRCHFRRTAWFGAQVLWLTPDPDGPFRELTRAVTAVFPGYPPYGGAFTDVIPHLTIGDLEHEGRPGAGIGELRAAEAGVLPALPLAAVVSAAWLMAGTTLPGSWHRLAELPLAPS